jgi:uncharacterized protein
MASLSFTDTLPKKMLNEYVYYRLVAVDLSNNHSEFSKVLEVKLPDRNAPTTPVIKDVIIKEDGVAISFLPSQSADVVSHTLFRKTNTSDWAVFKEFPLDKNIALINILDNTVEDNKTYQYAVLAKDDDGLVSAKSFAVPVRYFKSDKYQTVNKLDLKLDASKKTLTLTWAALTDPNISHYIIYRNVNNAGLEMINSTKNPMFTDTEYKENSSYQYAIRVAYTNGKMSKIGNANGLGQ